MVFNAHKHGEQLTQVVKDWREIPLKSDTNLAMNSFNLGYEERKKELTPRKKQILKKLFNKRISELNFEIGSAIQYGGEPEDILTEEKEHIEEMQNSFF